MISSLHLNRKAGIDGSGNKRAAYSNSFKSQFLIRARISMGWMTQSLGLKDQAMYHLKAAAKQATEQEQFDEALHAMYNLASLYVVSGNSEERLELLNAANQLEHERHAYYRVLELYGNHVQGRLLNLPKPQFATEQAMLDELETLKATASSSRFNYFYQQIQYSVATLHNDAGRAEKAANAMLEIVLTSIPLKQPPTIAFCFALIGEIQLSKLDFIGAEASIEQALNHTIPDEANHAVRCHQLALALYYQNEINQALKVIDTGISTATKGNPFVLAKLQLTKASIQLAAGQPTKAYHTLQLTTPLDEDKAEWNIAARVLAIITLMARDNFNQASSQITALTQHIRRHRNSTKISKRLLAIEEILAYWDKTGNHYELTHQHCLNLFTKLDAAAGEYQWQPDGLELIVFSHWYKDKLEGTPYKFRLPGGGLTEKVTA